MGREGGLGLCLGRRQEFKEGVYLRLLVIALAAPAVTPTPPPPNARMHLVSARRPRDWDGALRRWGRTLLLAAPPLRRAGPVGRLHGQLHLPRRVRPPTTAATASAELLSFHRRRRQLRRQALLVAHCQLFDSAASCSVLAWWGVGILSIKRDPWARPSEPGLRAALHSKGPYDSDQGQDSRPRKHGQREHLFLRKGRMRA